MTNKKMSSNYSSSVELAAIQAAVESFNSLVQNNSGSSNNSSNKKRVACFMCYKVLPIDQEGGNSSILLNNSEAICHNCQKEPSFKAMNSNGKKRVQCFICFKTFCDKVSCN